VAEVPARHLPASLELLAAHAADAEHPVPLVLRVPCGPGPFAGWDFPDAAALGCRPGIKVAVPATADAARALLAAAIRDPGPVVLLEPVSLYPVAAAAPPSGEQPVALGQARVARHGEDVTVVAWGAGVAAALEAAEEAAAQGVSAEVIDLQALVPVDAGVVLASVERTGRLVVVEGAAGFGGVGAEVAARVAQEGFWHLDGPVRRVPPLVSFPFRSEDSARSQSEDILAAVLSLAHT
jgi:pyruvate dehydrogenase E1 component beta subunit